MTKTGKKAGLPPISYVLLGLIGWFLFPQILAIFAPKADNNPRISYGNHLLIKTNSNTTKESAIAAIAQGNHQEAEQLLQKSLAQRPNDPESVIYLSNLQTGSNPFKIAVVVPATTNPNVAQEILRGVASAQTQINQQGGINGRKLMVIVVNDDNQPQISKEVASELVKNPDIIAVIGHNASDASLAAAPIYEKGGLVMISPTSLANNLSGAGNYIFRLVASNGKITETLANYIVNTAKVRKIAFCYDSQAPDNISFKDELMANVAKKGGQIVPIVCDLSVPNFKADQALNQAISGGASGLFVVAHVFVRQLDPEGLQSKREIRFIIESNQGATPALAGVISFHSPNFNNKVAEIGYWITKEYRGKSIGTTAVKVLTNFGFETMGWNRIEAMIDHDNEASKKVVTRAGYEHEGLLRQRVIRANGDVIDMDLFAVLQKNWQGLS